MKRGPGITVERDNIWQSKAENTWQSCSLSWLPRATRCALWGRTLPFSLLCIGSPPSVISQEQSCPQGKGTQLTVTSISPHLPGTVSGQLRGNSGSKREQSECNVTWDSGRESKVTVLGPKNAIVGRDRVGCVRGKQEAHKGWPVEKTGAEETGDWFKGRRSLLSNAMAQGKQGRKLEISLQRKKELVFQDTRLQNHPAPTTSNVLP